MKKIIFFILLGAVGASLVWSYIYVRTVRELKKEVYVTTPDIEKRVAAIKKVEKIKQLAKVAIVLDDFGYNMQNLTAIFELETPITFSILPHLGYSKRVAEKALQENCQVILHLPLEPHKENKRLEKRTILCSMDKEEVVQLMDAAIASVPGLVGISNHMGSKATEDEVLMSIVLEKVRKDNLFFMDNLVTSNSVCKNTAHKTRTRFIQRSVFLDNESGLGYIKNQINELQDLALKTGWAVGVGHDRPNTVLAIKELIPEMKKSGIKFVFLSELAK